MSTQPVSSVSAAGADAAPKRKFRLDDRYIAPAFITLILLAGHLSFGILESPMHTGLAILTSISVELILGRLFYGKWPHWASAYISGISVGILVRSPEVWPFVLCSAITITSKYVLRVDGRHIWNPSNFGISVLVALAHNSLATLSIQWGNHLYPMLVVWALGSIIIYRLRRFHITMTYVGCFFFFAFLRSLYGNSTFLAEAAPITGPMYQLYIFFMITDPKTTVKSKKWQIIITVIIAIVENIIRSCAGLFSQSLLFLAAHAPYYALFTVGPISNLIDIGLERKKKAAALAAKSA